MTRLERNTRMYHTEKHTDRTLNGESKVVVQKDGREIIVF